MNNFSLLGKGGEKHDCLFSLPDRPIGIGTDPDKCSIIYLQGKNNISAFHCQLVPKNGEWTLTDYSDKGTWLNGKKMTQFQEYTLKSGDVFYLANLENSFYFSVENAASSNQGQAKNPQWQPQNQNQGQAQPPQWPPQNQQQTQIQERGIKEKFFTYKGRLDRKTYIIRGFYLTAVNAIIWFLMLLILTICKASGDSLLLPFLTMLVLGLMLGIRRLHDLDKSGWYILISIVPIVNFYILYLLLVKEGTHGTNRFGSEYHYQPPSNLTQRKFEEKYLTFEGRLNRKPYILRQLCLLGLTIVIDILALFILTLVGSFEDDIYIIIQIVSAPCTYPLLLLDIRRLHDLDQSGWLVLIMFVPIINLIFLVYLLFVKGTVGSNRYGSDPLS